MFIFKAFQCWKFCFRAYICICINVSVFVSFVHGYRNIRWDLCNDRFWSQSVVRHCKNTFEQLHVKLHVRAHRTFPFFWHTNFYKVSIFCHKPVSKYVLKIPRTIIWESITTRRLNISSSVLIRKMETCGWRRYGTNIICSSPRQTFLSNKNISKRNNLYEIRNERNHVNGCASFKKLIKICIFTFLIRFRNPWFMFTNKRKEIIRKIRFIVSLRVVLFSTFVKNKLQSLQYPIKYKLSWFLLRVMFNSGSPLKSYIS